MTKRSPEVAFGTIPAENQYRAAGILWDATPVTGRSRMAHTPLFKAGRKPRVLLVDDHRRFLDTVSAMLSPDFDVVGVATDGTQAVDSAARLNPDVIVMDVQMPGLDGFQTLRAIKNLDYETRRACF